MAHAAESGRGRPRILVHYDDESTRTEIVEALRPTHDVVETKDAKAALALLGGTEYYFDVVIVACRARPVRVRQAMCVCLVLIMFLRWPWIPVVMVGRAHDQPELIAALLLSGVRQFLRAPWRAGELEAAVKRLVPRFRRRQPFAHGVVATMKRIIAFIGERFGDGPTLRELAAMATMSHSHFSHTFHAVIGMPLRDYIRDVRLKRANELLLGSPLPITAIALDVGFYDLPHFDKAFRQRIGLSPQAYRRRNARAYRSLRKPG